MKRDTASGIIKLTAILVVFIGLVLISVVFIQIQNMNNMFQEMSGQMETFGEMEKFMMASSGLGRTGTMTPVVIMIWGAILYALNRPLSHLVAKD